MKYVILSFLLTLSLTSFSQKLHPVKEGKLWGYADTSGKIVIPAQFYIANEFSHGVAYVMKEFKGEFEGDNYRVGMIDENGKLIQAIRYSDGPTMFGVVSIQPQYKGKNIYLGWLSHIRTGDIWVDDKGKIIVRAKRMFNTNDIIPEALWDY